MTAEDKKSAKKLLVLAKEHEKKYRQLIRLAGREQNPNNTLKTLNNAQIERRHAERLESAAVRLLKKHAGGEIGKALVKPRKIRTRFNA